MYVAEGVELLDTLVIETCLIGAAFVKANIFGVELAFSNAIEIEKPIMVGSGSLDWWFNISDKERETRTWEPCALVEITFGVALTINNFTYSYFNTLLNSCIRLAKEKAYKLFVV